MKRLLVLIMTSILALYLVACYSSAVKTYIDVEETISTRVNQEFIIALESSPATYYDWDENDECVSCKLLPAVRSYSWEESYDASMLSLEDKQYDINEKTESLADPWGTRYFRFKALKRGETEITFKYKQPWGTDYTEQKVFKVDIK